MLAQTFLAQGQHFFRRVGNLEKSFVARLTPMSVACADSTTATRKVKALTEFSSPFGSGSIAWKRRKTSAISCGLKRLAFAMNSLLK